MADDHQEVLASFLAFTGCDDNAVALGVLEATNWNLEQAVTLHYSNVAADDLPAQNPSAAPTFQSDEALARSLAGPQEDEVRAPLATRTERLYGENAAYVPGMIDRTMRGMAHSRTQQQPGAFQVGLGPATP
jgi:hypothetical protein